MNNLNLGEKEYKILMLATLFQIEQLEEQIAEDLKQNEVYKDALEIAYKIKENLEQRLGGLTLEDTQTIYTYLVIFRGFCKNSYTIDMPKEVKLETSEYINNATEIINSLERMFKQANIDISSFLTLHKNHKSFDQVVHRIQNKKFGRNDLCSCGSGKKFKHCCGN